MWPLLHLSLSSRWVGHHAENSATSDSGMGAREYPRADPRFSVALMGAAEAGDAPAVKEALAAGQKTEQRNEAG